MCMCVFFFLSYYVYVRAIPRMCVSARACVWYVCMWLHSHNFIKRRISYACFIRPYQTIVWQQVGGLSCEHLLRYPVYKSTFEKQLQKSIRNVQCKKSSHLLFLSIRWCVQILGGDGLANSIGPCFVLSTCLSILASLSQDFPFFLFSFSIHSSFLGFHDFILFFDIFISLLVSLLFVLLFHNMSSFTHPFRISCLNWFQLLPFLSFLLYLLFLSFFFLRSFFLSFFHYLFLCLFMFFLGRSSSFSCRYYITRSFLLFSFFYCFLIFVVVFYSSPSCLLL